MEKKRDLSWFFLLLLILGVLVLFLSQNEEPNHAKNPIPKSQQVDSAQQSNLVNKHLKETAINLERERLQRRMEASRQLENLSDTGQQDQYQLDSGLTFDTDQNMQSLTYELDRSQAVHDGQLTPEQIIQRRLYENEQLQREDQAYREAYAEQFIENARRGGWDVKLGPNFEVLSVKKIPENRRQPSNLFDHFSSGSR